jgi:hypothetical protein
VKRKSFKVFLALAVSFFIVSFIGMACTDELKAAVDEDVEDDYPVIVKQLAEKLDLDPEEIFKAFKNINEERKENLKKNFEEKLDEAVEEGDITEEQKEAVIAKREEVAEELQEIKDLPLSERREAMKDITGDLKEWAKENDIDFKELFPLVNIKPIRVRRFGMKHTFRFFRR